MVFCCFWGSAFFYFHFSTINLKKIKRKYFQKYFKENITSKYFHVVFLIKKIRRKYFQNYFKGNFKDI
jgi:hypothetical protein